jgi:hypothetical protein
MRTIRMLAWVLLTACAGSARAAAGMPARVSEGAGATARPDTTHVLPVWQRPWLEAGGGWLASPAYLHAQYESGMTLGIELEARRTARWVVRGAIDYQMLMAKHAGGVISSVDFGGPGGTFSDTLPLTFETAAWLATMRAETGRRVLGDLWLGVGAGGGFMNSGFNQYVDLLSPALQHHLPVAMRNGWGWLWTASARWEFEPVPARPFGIEVRNTTLMRGDDRLACWSIRVSARVPAGSHTGDRRGGGRHRHGRDGASD